MRQARPTSSESSPPASEVDANRHRDVPPLASSLLLRRARLLTAALLALYALPLAGVGAETAWGTAALAQLPVPMALAGLGLGFALMAAVGPLADRLERLDREPRLGRGVLLLIGLAATFLFVALKSHYIGGDAGVYLLMLERGCFWNLNSPLCFLVIGSLFGTLGSIAGPAWALWATFNIAAGVGFVLLIVVTCRRWGATAAAAAPLCLGSSALFFGHVETYAPLLPLLLLFVVAAERRFAGRSALPAALWFGLALAWSLMTVWAAPALLGLVSTPTGAPHQRDRLNRYPPLTLAVLPVTLTIALSFTVGPGPSGPFQGLHVSRLPNAGFVPPAELFLPGHLFDFAQEQLFLAAGVYLYLCLEWRRLVALVRRSRFDRWLVFLGGCLLLFAFLWNPALGPRIDWDLFALSGLPVGLMAARLIATGSSASRRAALLLCGAQAVHTMAWAAGLHGFAPG